MLAGADRRSFSPRMAKRCPGHTRGHSTRPTFDAADVSGTIQGDRVEFWFELQGSKATYTGTVEDNTMSGTCDYVGVGSGVWEGERVEGE